MNRYFVLTLLLANSLYAACQEELEGMLHQLEGLLEEVAVEDKTFQQQLAFDESEPYRIEITITETDQKGKQSETRFQLNLALLSNLQLTHEDVKNEMRVIMPSKQLETIRKHDDDKYRGYVKEAYLLAQDATKAREIETLIKAIIPLAESRWKEVNVLPTDYEELKNWILEKITDVSNESDKWSQQWQQEQEDNAILFKFVQVDKNDKQHDYDWNMADVSRSGTKVKVRGKWAVIELTIADQNPWIRYQKDGELDGYEDGFLIYFSEMDNALVTAEAIRELIKMAREIEESQQLEYSSVEDAFEHLQNSINQVDNTTEDISQSISGGCMAQYQKTVVTERKREENAYEFDFSDFFFPNVELSVKGKDIGVTVTTPRDVKYVYYQKNEEQQNYTNSVYFPATDLDNAKAIFQQVGYLIKTCPNDIELEDFAWLEKQAQASNNDELEQLLSKSVENDSIWELSQIETTRRGRAENKWVFNLQDLNPKRMELVVKGKTVNVLVETLRDEDNVAKIEDGQNEGFTNQVAILMPNISIGKIYLESLRSQIESIAK